MYRWLILVGLILLFSLSLGETQLELNQRLHRACRHSDIKAVREALIAGADPNWFANVDLKGPKFSDGLFEGSCLNLAVGVPIKELLIRSGASAIMVDGFGDNPLVGAAGYGDLDSIKLLLKLGVPVDSARLHGNSALVEAARRGDVEVVKYLITRGANVNFTGEWGVTPLIGATRVFSNESGAGKIKYDRRPLILLLLKSGADPNIRIRDHSILEVAATRRQYANGTDAEVIAILKDAIGKSNSKAKPKSR